MPAPDPKATQTHAQSDALIGNLPPALAAKIAGCTWEKDDLGCSGAAVFKLRSEEGRTWFLKTAVPPHAGAVVAEAERLAWLAGKLPAPQILSFAARDGTAYLLVTAVPGEDMTAFNQHAEAEKETAVRLLAAGLRQIHRLFPAGCPFDRRLALTLVQARRRLEAGLVDTADFDADWQGWDVADLYAELLATRPTAAEDLVFTHGDYCLPNILAHNGRVSGFVDLGRAGVADRYQDLALGWRSANYNYGPGWGDRFLAAYGLQQPDPARLTFYRLLDEFF